MEKPIGPKHIPIKEIALSLFLLCNTAAYIGTKTDLQTITPQEHKKQFMGSNIIDKISNYTSFLGRETAYLENKLKNLF